MAEVEIPGCAGPWQVVVVTKNAKVFEEQCALFRLAILLVVLDALFNILALGCPQDATPKIVTRLAIGHPGFELPFAIPTLGCAPPRCGGGVAVGSRPA